MRLKISLNNSAGELDAQTVTVPPGADDEAASNMLKDIISEWRLDAGDVIKIEEETAGVTVNSEQRLYVIPGAGGYSCLGFDVCERRLTAVAAWAGITFIPREVGTLEHYGEYLSVMALAEAHATRTKTRCPAELSPQLIGLEGKRVEVTAPGEGPRRFYVGKSTGWLPCHLEVARRDSTGGGAVYIPEGATVRVVGAR